MKLLDIIEPYENKQNIQSTDIAVGIDFGTTNCLISAVIDTKPVILGESGLISSKLSFIDNEIIVNSDISKVSNFTIKSIKRLLAKSYKDLMSSDSVSSNIKEILFLENTEVKLRIQDQSFSLVFMASKIFSYLKSEAEKYLKQDVTKAVITVPAHFDDVARNKVKQAAELSGLQILRIISEPTAAAYAYGLENASQGNYLVYDLGGGTFDVSILRMQMGAFQVLRTAGDHMLGGDDIDASIACYIKSKLELTELTPNQESDLLTEVQKAKELLSSCQEVEILIAKKKVILTKDILKEIAKPFIDRTIKITKDVIELSDNIEINGIILVGGCSRLEYVYEALKKNFSNIPLLSNLDPDKIVSYGAARQAYNLTHQAEDLLIDITPLSLGIEVLGGFIERIIERHSPIPNKTTKYFTTSCDNQTGIIINVVQGEREMVSQCRKLATFELSGLPQAIAGTLQIAVTFQVDADGLLSVSALEAKSNNKCDVVVRPYYDLDEEKVDEMLYDAFKNSEKDHILKALNEAKMNIKILITNLTKMLFNANEIFTADEKLAIESLITEAEHILNSNELEDINNYLKILETDAEKISTKFLDYKIKQTLEGKNIDEL